jgi:hypothetical protein
MSLNLTLSSRLHEIIRQTSIRNIYEAIVELVTNCDDAYRTIGKIRKDIWIEIVRNDDKTSLLITDQASGMTYDEMVSNLLTVGNYTANESSRGMMGRGAKDCSFLGDITFTCIKNNKMNQLTIYQNRTADFIFTDVDVTTDIRLKYGIIENGCNVELIVSSSLVPPIETVFTSLKNNIYFRNLLQEESTIVLLKDKDFTERLFYRFPERKLVVSCDYDIPEYNTTAHFELYRSDKELTHAFSPDQMQYGILVSSDKTIYESSALYYIDNQNPIQDYMWNPNIKFISGILICNDIERIAREATNGNISAKNPFLLIDPNRRNGLVRDHPFTVALFKYAYQLLDIIIGRIQDSRDDKLIENGNASDVFNSLNDLISQLLPPESVLYTWRTKDDQTKLNTISSTIKNVNLDSDFLGLTWEEIQNLSKDRYLQLEQKPVSGNSFKLSFTNDINLKSPYQILYLPGQISMKINANDPSVKDYIEISDNTVNLVNSGKALTSIGMLVLDATNNMVIRRNIMDGSTSSLDINAFNEYIFNLIDVRKSIAPSIFEKISLGIQSIKSNEAPSSLPMQ